MAFKPIFFYNAEASQGAGGETIIADAVIEKTDEGQEVDKKVDTSVVEKIELPAEVLAKLKDYEELVKYKADREAEAAVPQKTKEEIAKEAEVEKVNLKKYAVENNIAADEDFIKFDTLQQKKDADLVFEGFLADFKEENPDIDEKDIEDEAKTEFEKTYKLNSENAKVKEKGLAKLAKEAGEIRTPYKSKVETAQTKYNEEKEIRANMPKFDKFITEQISKNAPDKVSYKIKSGEDEISVDIDLSKEDKEAIAKEFSKPKTYIQFAKSPADAEKSLQKKIQGWILTNKREEILSKTAEKFTGIGVAKGSTTGANNLFAIAGDKNKNKVEVVDNKSNQEANRAAQKYRNNR